MSTFLTLPIDHFNALVGVVKELGHTPFFLPFNRFKTARAAPTHMATKLQYAVRSAQSCVNGAF